MSKSRAEVKAEIMEMVEARLEKLLSWEAKRERPTLSEIEEQVLAFRRTVSERVTEKLIEKQEGVKPVGGVNCPACGQKMKYKDMQPKQVSSLVGELRLERGYYHCQGCQRGFFPPR